MSAKKSASNLRLQDIEEFRARIKLVHAELPSVALVFRTRIADHRGDHNSINDSGLVWHGPRRMWQSQPILCKATQDLLLGSFISEHKIKRAYQAEGKVEDPRREMIEFYTDGEERAIGAVGEIKKSPLFITAEDRQAFMNKNRCLRRELCRIVELLGKTKRPKWSNDPDLPKSFIPSEVKKVVSQPSRALWAFW